MTQLAKLAQRIPDKFVEQVRSQGGLQSYIAHHVINQFLLYIVGPFSFELVEVHRGDVLERVNGKFTESSMVLLRGVVVGATFRLTCIVDGQRTVIEQTGDVESPTNWQHDGARLKDAESDALKRAAMRLGLGLELWAQEHYKLDKWLPLDDGGQPKQSEGRGERADDGQTGMVAAASGNGSGEPATTRRPSDSTPAGAVELSDRAAPAPAGHTPGPGPDTQAPAGAASLAPAGPVDPDLGPDPDELLASLGADATTAEREFAKAGLTIPQAHALFIDRYGTNMEAQYAERNLRRLRGKVIDEYVADAVKLRAAKIAALREQAQAEVAEATT